MRIQILLAFILACSIVNGQIPKVSDGKIIRYRDFQSDYVNTRNVDVWLPEGYTVEKKYSVIYMHDGQMLFDSTTTWNKQEWRVDETMSRLLIERKIKDCIVVGISNSDEYRRSDYLPEKALQLMPTKVADSIIDHILMGKPHADAYLKFIVKELKPFIDKNFSTFLNQSNTFIMGSSMGGLISMYAICEYPDVFNGAACLSTHWYGDPVSWNKKVPAAYLLYFEENLPDPNNHKLYFDHGTETLDQYYEPFQKKADSIFMRAGYSGHNFKSLIFPGQAHTENAWADRLEIPILFLMGKD